MAKLTRIFQKIFARTSQENELSKFGSLAAGSPAYVEVENPEQVQELANFEQGWYGAVIGNNSPAIQDMNSLFYLAYRQIAYLFQQGIAEWDNETEYHEDGLSLGSDGKIYQSIAGPNVGVNPVGNPSEWRNILENTAPSFGGVVSVDNSDSPYVIQASALGQVYAVDCTSGNVVISIPEIGSVDTVNKSVSIIKIDSSSNVVTINRSGTDTINGSTSYTLSVKNEGGIFSGEESTDDWRVLPVADYAGSAAAFKDATTLLHIGSPHAIGIDEINRLYEADASANDVELDLPSIASLTSINKSLFVVKVDESTNKVIINPNGADTIGGNSDLELTVEGSGVILVADVGTDNWAIAQTGVSSGGGSGEGGVNFLPPVRLAAAWTGFNESTYVDGLGGSLAGLVLTDNTTTPVSSPSDLKIAKSAVDAQGDGFSIDTITIDPEFRGTRAYLKFFYDATSTDYTEDDLVIKVYDVTNSAILGVAGIQNLGTAGEIKKISDNAIAAITIPATCAAIRVSLWLETDSETASTWDMFVSTRIGLVPDAPVVRDYQPLKANFFTSATSNTWVSNKLRFTTLDEENGNGLMAYSDDATDGTRFTAIKSCYVSVSIAYQSAVTTTANFDIRRNGAFIMQGLVNAAANVSVISSSILLAPGDYLDFARSGVGILNGRQLALVATEATQPAIVSGNELAFKPIKFVATKASGACTADTTIPAWVVDAGNETGNFNATTGVFTAPKKMMAYVSFQPLFTTNAARGTQIHKNGNVWVAEPAWVSSSRMASVSSLINLEPGDTVTTVSAASGGTLAAPTTFTLHEIPDLSVFAAYGFPDPAKLNTALGAAPSYSARAAVQFIGTTPPTLTGSKNVTSVVRNSTGNYTVNFATAMGDADYVAAISVEDGQTTTSGGVGHRLQTQASGSVNFTTYAASTLSDVSSRPTSVIIFK